MTAAWMIPAKDLKPGQIGLSPRGVVVRKTGPMNRIECIGSKGLRYTMQDDEPSYVFIGWL